MALMTAVSKVHALVANTATKIADANALRVNLFVETDVQLRIGGSDLSSTNGFSYAANQLINVPATGCQAEIWALCTVNRNIYTLEFNVL